MKRALVPVILSTAIMITACSGSQPAATPPAADNPPVSTPQPPSADPPPPQTQPAPSPKPAEPPKPEIKWYTKDIGYPLTSDDPAAAGKKVALLSYDDGPTDEGPTAAILDTLKQNGVKAMFFITGYGAKNIDLVKRIHAEGHVLAVHANTHADLTTLTKEGVKSEIEPLIKVIEEVTGAKPRYFRPPFGMYNEIVREVAKEYNLEILNWSVGSKDWVDVKDGYKDPKIIVNDVMDQMHQGAVILFHDTHKHTAEATPMVIEKLKAEGYEFVVLR